MCWAPPWCPQHNHGVFLQCLMLPSQLLSDGQKGQEHLPTEGLHTQGPCNLSSLKHGIGQPPLTDTAKSPVFVLLLPFLFLVSFSFVFSSPLFFFLCFIFYFFFLLFVLSTSPFFSCVNFQVPLIIIVPHPGAPHLPLLPLPMTATSYHGNHMKLQGDSLGLHIVPVWPIPPPLGRWREPRRAPPQHTSLSTAPSARHTRLRTPFSPHPPAPWGTSGALNSTSAQLDLLRSQDLRGTGSHCLAGPHSPGSGMGRGKQGDSCSLNTDPQRYAPLWWTLQNA